MSAPSWVLPKAKFDLDFIKQRYYGGFVDMQANNLDPTSLCADGGGYSGYNPYTPTRSGILALGKPGANRITDLGLFVERAAHNYCLYCRDMSQATQWSNVSNVTASKNQTGADGSSSTASSLTATGTNATISQNITLTSQAYVYSAYIKRITGTGTISMTMDGSTYTDITSQLKTTGYTWVQIASQTLTSAQVGFKIATSGDEIAVDFNQMENAPSVGQYATTPIITTTASVARTNAPGYFQATAQIGSHANFGQSIINNVFQTGGPYTMLMSWNGDCTSNTNLGPCILASDSAVFLNNGATFTNGRGNWNITAVRVNGNGQQNSTNGSALTANSTARKPALNTIGTHFNLGNNGSGSADYPLDGSIGRVTFWACELTDAQMIAYTNVANGYGIA